jgi:[acyl-carrier-protein] S-malonyltransferase
MESKLAFVFPGQGSQSQGMLLELFTTFSAVKNTFSEAQAILGYDLWDLIQSGPVEKLNQTEYAQPALLAAGVAIWRAWRAENGTLPIVAAGHSLGEYTALVCAEALAFADALPLVRDRGRYMQSAYAGQGAMAALVGLADEDVRAICQEAAEKQVLVPANYNSLGQIVVSGELDAVNRAVKLAQAKGAKLAKVLPVSVPSHCILMQPAVEKLAAKLETISVNSPLFPVIHNADVASYTNPQEIKKALVKQLVSPVRWVETIQYMEKSGINAILECGPGKVLTGLNKKIVNTIDCTILGTVEGFKTAIQNHLGGKNL